METNNSKSYFAQRLKKIMIEKNIKQYELAEHIGVRAPTITLYVQGETEPNATKIAQIAKFLGVTTDYLLGVDEDETTDKMKMCDYLGLSLNNLERLNTLKLLGLQTTLNNSMEFLESLVLGLDSIEAIANQSCSDLLNSISEFEKALDILTNENTDDQTANLTSDIVFEPNSVDVLNSELYLLQTAFNEFIHKSLEIDECRKLQKHLAHLRLKHRSIISKRSNHNA